MFTKAVVVVCGASILVSFQGCKSKTAKTTQCPDISSNGTKGLAKYKLVEDKDNKEVVVESFTCVAGYTPNLKADTTVDPGVTMKLDSCAAASRQVKELLIAHCTKGDAEAITKFNAVVKNNINGPCDRIAFGEDATSQLRYEIEADFTRGTHYKADAKKSYKNAIVPHTLRCQQLDGTYKSYSLGKQIGLKALSSPSDISTQLQASAWVSNMPTPDTDLKGKCKPTLDTWKGLIGGLCDYRDINEGVKSLNKILGDHNLYSFGLELARAEERHAELQKKEKKSADEETELKGLPDKIKSLKEKFDLATGDIVPVQL